jgi:hypothetical protein
LPNIFIHGHHYGNLGDLDEACDTGDFARILAEAETAASQVSILSRNKEESDSSSFDYD